MTSTRRQLLCGLAVGVLATGALAGCSAGHVGQRPEVSPGQVSPAPGTRLAAVADVPVGGGLVVNGPTGKVLLLQPTAGTITAFDARCPHAGSTVAPPVNGVIVCPAHGSAFDGGSGARQQGPARTGLLPVAVTVGGTDVLLA